MANSKSLKRRVPAARTAKHDKVEPDPAKPADAEQEPAETERRTKTFIQPDVLKLIRDNNGEPVTLEELITILGSSKSSVQHAAGQLVKSVPQIEVVTRGHVWRWNGKGTDAQVDNSPITEDFGPVPEPPRQEETVNRPSSSRRLYTSVGKAGDGTPIVRDYEDNLYRLVAL